MTTNSDNEQLPKRIVLSKADQVNIAAIKKQIDQMKQSQSGKVRRFFKKEPPPIEVLQKGIQELEMHLKNRCSESLTTLKCKRKKSTKYWFEFLLDIIEIQDILRDRTVTTEDEYFQTKS